MNPRPVCEHVAPSSCTRVRRPPGESGEPSVSEPTVASSPRRPLYRYPHPSSWVRSEEEHRGSDCEGLGRCSEAGAAGTVPSVVAPSAQQSAEHLAEHLGRTFGRTFKQNIYRQLTPPAPVVVRSSSPRLYPHRCPHCYPHRSLSLSLSQLRRASPQVRLLVSSPFSC